MALNLGAFRIPGLAGGNSRTTSLISPLEIVAD